MGDNRWPIGDPDPAEETTSGTVPGSETIAAFGDLMSRLRFSPGDGRIWLDDRRMMLLDCYAMEALRLELIESLGIAAARGLLTRVGYGCGTRDAELARKVRKDEGDVCSAFLAGPQLHALEGVVQVSTAELLIDTDKGRFYGDFIWRDSSEAEMHIQNYGVGSEPACWMQVGYASGYSSAFLGRPILFKENQCSAMGHAHCRIIGKPTDEWENAEGELQYLRPQPFVSRAIQEMDPVMSRSASTAAKTGEQSRDDEKKPAGAATGPRKNSSYAELVGISARFNAACHMLSKVAPTDATVLFLGESGVGKELFARTLHRISTRSGGPFVAVNCAAIPENLVEAELFGVEKGAYTGAVNSRPGRFELAECGTLFLDEVGTLSLEAQGKLLRALQEREIERVGSTTTVPVDVRVIAATNVNLREACRAGEFREDLFFRLNVFPIRIPPLRERRDDIPLLMETFLHRYAKRHNRSVSGFTSRAVEALLGYSWPGNIRELENIVERGIILAPEGGAIDLGHLFIDGENSGSSFFHVSVDGSLDTSDKSSDLNAEGGKADLGSLFLESGQSLDEWENILVSKAMDEAGGNITNAAKILGITRARLDYRVKKMGSDLPRRGK